VTEERRSPDDIQQSARKDGRLDRDLDKLSISLMSAPFESR